MWDVMVDERFLLLLLCYINTVSVQWLNGIWISPDIPNAFESKKKKKQKNCIHAAIGYVYYNWSVCIRDKKNDYQENCVCHLSKWNRNLEGEKDKYV